MHRDKSLNFRDGHQLLHYSSLQFVYHTFQSDVKYYKSSHIILQYNIYNETMDKFAFQYFVMLKATFPVTRRLTVYNFTCDWKVALPQASTQRKG